VIVCEVRGWVRKARLAAPPLACDGLYDSPRGFGGRFVLPDSDDLPSGGLERGIVGAIASDVARELRLPEADVRLRMGRVFGAAVPEAAVDEHRHARGSEHEVGTDAAAGEVKPAVLAVAEAARVEL